MDEQFTRTALLVGEGGIKRLSEAHVAIFGLGGVGGHCTDALARAGVGKLTLVDNDTIAESNINRQLIALHSTVGRLKTDVMRERLYDINPALVIDCHPIFVDGTTIDSFPFGEYDFVVDAIDTVTAKLLLIERCAEAGTRIISSMGTGNKLMKEPFLLGDISETSVCPLARVMRTECRKRGIKSLRVLYSMEAPLTPAPAPLPEGKRQVPGSISYGPSSAGLMIAGDVIRTLLTGGTE